MDPITIGIISAILGGLASAGGAAIGNKVFNPQPKQGKGQKNMAPGGQGRAPGPQGPAPGWGNKAGGDQLQGGKGGLWSGQSPFIERAALYEPKQGAFQSGALDQALKMLQGGLANPYQFTHNFDFQPIANEARMNFAQNTIPSILERFESMGGGRSSGLLQQLSQAGANLESGLASQKAQQGNQWGLEREKLGLQSLGQQRALFELFSALGNRPQYDLTRNPGQQGLGESILPDLLKQGIEGGGKILGEAAGQAVGNYFGNKAGNAVAGNAAAGAANAAAPGAPAAAKVVNPVNNVAAKLAVARAGGYGR
jgi:hypothetical protein